MSRTMPSECPHGFVYDWGDFGCQEEECYGTCELSPPEPCTEGCGNVPTDLVLTDAAESLLALAGALKASQDANDELVRQLESARRWAVHLEGENARLEAAAQQGGER